MSGRTKTAWGLFFTFALLGFLLATQARVQESRTRDLELQSADELTTLIGTLNQEIDRLQSEVTDLSLLLLRDRYAERDNTSEIVQQQRTVSDLLVVNGLVQAYGAGLHLRIEDPRRELSAYDLDQLINELKSAGAEAISLNEMRLDLRSHFTNRGREVALDGRVLSHPYLISAVGSPDQLYSSLVMAGGVIPSLQSRPEVTINLERRSRIDVPADRNPPGFAHASSRGE